MDSEGALILHPTLREPELAEMNAPKQRKLRSAVWNDMTKQPRGDGTYFAICNHCKKKMLGSSAMGTTHLKNHLRFCSSFRNSRSEQILAVTSEKEGPPLSLPKRRKLRSAVWNEMTKEHRGDGGYFAVCNHCEKKMVGNSASGTTHLKNHLRSCPSFRNSKNSNLGAAEGNDEGKIICSRLPRQRKLRSAVWNDMTKEQREDGSYFAVCNHCKKKMTGNSARGTTHLKNHLRFCAAFKLSGQLEKVNANDLDCFEFDHQRSRRDFACMLILHGYPVDIVDHIGLRRFLRNLQPRFKLMSREAVRADCIGIYRDERRKLQEMLLTSQSRINLAVGLCSRFLCLTCHFVDDNWKLQRRILSFVKLRSVRDWSEILKVVDMEACDWQIGVKLFGLVIEEATDGPLLFQCWASVLDLLVEDSLKVNEVNAIIERIQEHMWHARKSQMSWQSTLWMLEAALECRDEVQADVNWDDVRDVVECLSLFREARSKFSSCSKQPIISHCFIDLCSLYLRTKDWVNGPGPCIQCMAAKMYNQLEAHLNRVNPILVIGSVLDPRFKMKSVDYLFDQIYYDDCSERIKIIRVELSKMYDEYANRVTSRAEPLSCGQPSSENTLDFMRKGLGHLLLESSSGQPRKSDVDLYLDDDVLVSDDDHFDVLKWWMHHAERYPVLSMMARDVLAVPVSVEAAKNTAVDFCRSGVDDQSVLCTREWLRGELEESLEDESVDCLSSIFSVVNRWRDGGDALDCDATGSE